MIQENFKNFKNLIFDLGGVLFDIDYHKTIEAFVALGVNDFEELYSKAKQNHIFDDFEIGKISNDSFRNYICSLVNKKIADSDIDFAWNAMLLDFAAEKFNTLKKLKPHYNLYLLSNTNAIHLPMVQKMIQEKHNTSLENYFDKCYYSNIINLRKPNAEAFLKVINENNLNISETIFFDDSPQHIAGAAAIGLAAFHIKDIQHTEQLFNFNA